MTSRDARKRYGLRPAAEGPAGDRTGFPAQSSVLDEWALLDRVLGAYAIPPASTCRFLTRGDGDVYRPKTFLVFSTAKPYVEIEAGDGQRHRFNLQENFEARIDALRDATTGKTS